MLRGLALWFVAGVGIGTLYFGTLWLVVRRLHRVARPALWLGATGIGRLVVALGLFALLIDGGWARLVAALVGFLAVRVALTRRVAVAAGRRPHAAAASRRIRAGLG
jgi:F1F0 ATPase subunit 2